MLITDSDIQKSNERDMKRYAERLKEFVKSDAKLQGDVSFLENMLKSKDIVLTDKKKQRLLKKLKKSKELYKTNRKNWTLFKREIKKWEGDQKILKTHYKTIKLLTFEDIARRARFKGI